MASGRNAPPYHRFSEVVRRSQWQRFTAWLGNSSRRISAVGFAGLRPLCSTTAPRFVVGSEDGQTRFLTSLPLMVGRGTRLRLVAAMKLLPVSSCGVLKPCGTVVRAGAVRPLGKEHERERGCGEGNEPGMLIGSSVAFLVPSGFVVSGAPPLVRAAPTDAVAQRGGPSRTRCAATASLGRRGADHVRPVGALR